MIIIILQSSFDNITIYIYVTKLFFMILNSLFQIL